MGRVWNFSVMDFLVYYGDGDRVDELDLYMWIEGEVFSSGIFFFDFLLVCLLEFRIVVVLEVSDFLFVIGVCGDIGFVGGGGVWKLLDLL